MHLSLENNNYPLHSSPLEKHGAWEKIFKGLESSPCPRLVRYFKFYFSLSLV